LPQCEWYYTATLNSNKRIAAPVFFGSTGFSTISIEPVVIPRDRHPISRANISPNALKVLYRLKNTGHRACLVGGGVRDLMLGREPKDFDIATDAHPDEVRRLFRNCRLIGRRFRLAHVHFGPEIIEVATFRALHDGDAGEANGAAALDHKGRIVRDNVYGEIDEDALRRDFTVNALYYDIADFSVLDYTGGVEDLEAGVIRLIGDPERRYREDPVRMLRAVRFAAKLGLRLHPDTEAPIWTLGGLLDDIPSARLFDEVLKLFMSGQAVQTFELLRHYDLFRHLFPSTETALSHEEQGFPHMLVIRALENTDARVSEGKPVTPAFLYATMLWEPLRERAQPAVDQGMPEHQALQMAADQTLRDQIGATSIPRRFSLPVRDIWGLQARLRHRAGKRVWRVFEHPRFRAAYDFMLLRNQAGEDLEELCDWWTRFQEVDEAERSRMVAVKRDPAKPRRRRPPRSRPSPQVG